MTVATNGLCKELGADTYDGPLDVWIKNDGAEDWVFVGQTIPYGRRKRGFLRGFRVPEYGHLLTGNTHSFVTVMPGDPPE